MAGKARIPKVYNIRKAQRPVNGIIFWAEVESLSPPFSRHTVTIEQYRGKLFAHCSCPAKALFNPRQDCMHSKAVLDELKKPTLHRSKTR